MALSPSEKIFVTKLKDAGYTPEQALESLKKQRQKKTGSFAGRLNLATQDVSPDIATKGEAITQATQDLNAAPDKTSVMDVVTGKKNIYGETIPEQGGLTDLAVGAAKGVASAVSGAAELGEKGLQAVTGIKPTYAGGAETAGELVKESEALQAEGTDQKVGKFIGENVLPAMAGGIAGTSAKVLGGGSKVAQGLLGFLGSSAGGTAGYTVGAKGDLPSAKELATGAVIDAATLGTLKYFPKVFSGVKGAIGKVYDLAKNKGLSPMTVDAVESLAKNTSPENAKTIMDGLVEQEVAYMKDKISNPSTLMTTGKSIFKDFTEKLLPAKKEVGSKLASEVASLGEVQSKDALVQTFNDALESIGVKPQLIDNGVNLSALPEGQVPDFLAQSSKTGFALDSGIQGIENFSKGFGKFTKAIPGLDSLDLPSAISKAESLYAKSPNKTLEEFLSKFGRFDETFQEVFDASKYTADEAFDLVKNTASNVKTSGLTKGGGTAQYVLSPDSFKGSDIRFTADDQKALTKVYDDLMAMGDNVTASDQWSLSKALNTLLDYNSKLASQVTKTGETPLVALKKKLTENIKSAFQSEGKDLSLFSKYAEYSDAIDALNTRLGEGGEGGFSILKALQGEQKFGQEVRNALDVMKGLTKQDYFQQVRNALAASEIAGNEQVKSLLATTSKAGLLEEIVRTGFMDKKAILNRLVEETPGVARETLEKTVSALAKILGVELVAGE